MTKETFQIADNCSICLAVSYEDKKPLSGTVLPINKKPHEGTTY